LSVREDNNWPLKHQVWCYILEVKAAYEAGTQCFLFNFVM
jgi:hypothetical protein